jgi:hypothetical protein
MPEGKGVGHFLQGETAGLPNWAWGLVVVGGIAAAYIVPKFLNPKQPDQASTGTGTDASGLGLAIDPTTGLPYAVEGLVPSGAGAGGGTTITTAPGQLPPLPTPTPTPTPTPVPIGKPIPHSTNTNPIIPSGQYKGPSFSNLRPGTRYTYQGVNYLLKAGAEGRLWGINPHGQQVLLYGPPSAYSMATNSSTYITVGQWPYAVSSVTELAARYGLTEDRLIKLNPHLVDPSTLYAGETVRVA